MTQERIQTRYPLGGPFATQAELEQAITQAITAHKQDFLPLLERLVDEGNPAVNLSQEHPPQVLRIELALAGEGAAEGVAGLDPFLSHGVSS